jgi:acetyl esterase/lipase
VTIDPQRIEGIEFTPGLLLDLVIPAESSGPVPVILWLHGGGWRIGDRGYSPDLARSFAQDGFAMASADYRLTNEAIFPAQLDDVLAAVTWLGTAGTAYGLDPDRIGIWGSSAGGHLGALAALSAKANQLLDGSIAVRSVAEAYAPVDLTTPDQSVPMTEALLGGEVAALLELARTASPALADLTDAPPFLIMHGLADELVLPDQSRAFYSRLAAAGADVTLYEIDGLRHGFFDPIVPSAPDNPRLDPGRLLEPGSTAPARVVRSAPNAAETHTTGTASLETVRDFFRRTLLHDAGE